MKKFIFFLSVLCTGFTQAQVGIGTENPDPSAQIDIVASDKGMTIPNLALVSRDKSDPVTDPVNGLLIFNTTNDPANNLQKGLYSWDEAGGYWDRIVNTGDFPSIIEGYAIETGYLVANSADGQKITGEMVLIFTSVDLDRESTFNTGSSSYTIPFTGDYIVQCGMEIKKTYINAYSEVIVNLYRNNSLLSKTRQQRGNIPGTAYESPFVRYVGHLSAGDVLVCKGESAGTGTTRQKFFYVTKL